LHLNKEKKAGAKYPAQNDEIHKETFIDKNGYICYSSELKQIGVDDNFGSLLRDISRRIKPTDLTKGTKVTR